jgi:hypothetical protein
LNPFPSPAPFLIRARGGLRGSLPRPIPLASGAGLAHEFASSILYPDDPALVTAWGFAHDTIRAVSPVAAEVDNLAGKALAYFDHVSVTLWFPGVGTVIRVAPDHYTNGAQLLAEVQAIFAPVHNLGHREGLPENN